MNVLRTKRKPRDDYLTKQFLDDDGVDMRELNYVLKRNGVLLSRLLLATIFTQVDTNKSGIASLHELKAYVFHQNVDPMPSQVRWAIARAGCRDDDVELSFQLDVVGGKQVFCSLRGII